MDKNNPFKSNAVNFKCHFRCLSDVSVIIYEKWNNTNYLEMKYSVFKL